MCKVSVLIRDIYRDTKKGHFKPAKIALDFACSLSPSNSMIHNLEAMYYLQVFYLLFLY